MKKVSPTMQKRLKHSVNTPGVKVTDRADALVRAYTPVVEKGLVTLHTLEDQLKHIQSVDPKTATPEDYEIMDKFFGDITRELNSWANQLKIPAIDPIKAGILALEKLDRSVRQPYERLQSASRTWMTDYKRFELQRVQEAEEAQEKERQKLLADAELKRRQAEAVSSPQLKRKYVSEASKLEAKILVQGEMVPLEEATSTNVGTRLTTKWRTVGSREQDQYPTEAAMKTILSAILKGDIPLCAVMLDKSFISQAFKLDNAKFLEWPGFEIYDDVTIVRK